MTRPGNPRFERGDARVGVHRAQNPEAPHTLKPPDLALDPVQPPRLPRLALGIGIAGRLRGCGHVAFLAAVQGPQSHLVASANGFSPSISTGLVNPNRRMLSAICRTCLGECVRALRGHGRNWSMCRVSTAQGVIDVETGRLVKRLDDSDFRGKLGALAISPVDDKVITSTPDAKGITIWDLVPLMYPWMEPSALGGEREG
jgi:hypothetical protein